MAEKVQETDAEAKIVTPLEKFKKDLDAIKGQLDVWQNKVTNANIMLNEASTNVQRLMGAMTYINAKIKELSV